MNIYLLDTSALLTLRDDEAGADVVADLLQDTQSNTCYACFMTQMEILYRVWKDEGEQAGKLAYEQCMALPIQWVLTTDELLQKAAEMKACYPISLADAWIAAAAILTDATLVHKDPEFENLSSLSQLRLPYK